MPKSLHSERHQLLAKAIAEQRKRKGLTQQQLAAALGRHQPFIANIESGERRVDVVELIDLAAEIELDVAALLAELGRMKRS